MADAAHRSELPSRRALWPLGVAVTLLVAAWLVQDAGMRHVDALELSRFGDCEDICDSLARSQYVATHAVGFHGAAAVLGWLSVVAFACAIYRGSIGVVGMVAGFVSVGSAVWFLLAWVVTSLFAS